MPQPNAISIVEVSIEEAPWDMLLEADPSRSMIEKYLSKSTCYLAKRDGAPVGVVVLQQRSADLIELMNLAVTAGRRNLGIAHLLRHAIHIARDRGVSRLELGTGTFGPQLAFYQKAGFRVHSIDRDFFVNNYDQPIHENGLRHIDMLRLSLDLSG